MADVISLLLTAKNDASKAINQVQKDLTGLQKTAAASKTTASTMDKGMAAIGGAFAAGAFGATISQIVSSSAELSQAGANFDRLAVSFESLASQNGTSGAEIIQSIDAVTQGTLSNSEIMKQANAAMLLGVANTGEEFSTLAKIAVDRGRAMGISMEYAFESIVKGVGRLSPLILDNLGIIIDADETYGEYAKTIGKTADALTDMEKRQALISRLKIEVANFDPNSVLDAASAWERLAAAQSNAAAAFGSWINNDSRATGFLGVLIDSLNVFAGKASSDATIKLKGLETELEMAKSRVSPLAKAMLDLSEAEKARSGKQFGSEFSRLLKQLYENTQGEVKGIEEEITKLKKLMALEGMEDKGAKHRDTSAAEWKADEAQRKETELTAYAMKEIGTSADYSKEEIKAMVDNIIKMAPNIDVAAAAVDRLITGFANAKAMVEAMNSAIGGAVSGFNSAVFGAFEDTGFNQDIIDTAKAIRPAFDQAIASIKASGYSLYDTEAAVMRVEEQYASTFTNISEDVADANKALNATGSSTKQLTKEFSSLRGIVEGVFSTAQSDFEGLGIDEILPREDAVNENARRLADIAKNGFKDQSWLEEFKNEAGGAFADIKLLMASGMDAQGAAKKVLKDFQNGLRPDLIDRNMVKDIAKRMFYVDQETTKMIDEIAKELAGELGISVEEAKGLAGSAMGKKNLTPEAMQQIIDDNMKGVAAVVPFDWKDKASKIQEGIDAGVLNKDGYFVIPVWFESADGSPVPKDLAKPEGVGIRAPINDSTINLSSVTGNKVKIELSFPTKEEVATETEVVTKSIAETPITVPITTDPEVVRSAGMAAFAEFANGFILPENLSMFGLAASTGIANSFVEYGTAYVTTGGQIGLYMLEGFRNQGLGAMIAAELNKQLGESQRAFENSANNAGKVWGNAFITVVKGNVPFELLLALTDLITPEVIKKIAANDRGGDK